MPFNKELDKNLFSEKVDFETTRITVGVFSYNEGTAKLQVVRENMNPTGEWSFAKLGRMTKVEVEKLLPIMEKAIEHM